MEVNGLRLKYFLQELGEIHPRESVSQAIQELPKDFQEICRQPRGWMPREIEEQLLSFFKEKFKQPDILFETGKACLQTLLTHILPANPWMRTADSVVAGLPSFISLFTTVFSGSIERDPARDAFYLHLDFRADFKPDCDDILFVLGMVDGLLDFLRSETHSTALLETQVRIDDWQATRYRDAKFSAGHNIIYAEGKDLGRQLSTPTGTDPNVNTQQLFVRQVLLRSSQLLQDKRELVTAVEYLNMANDELEKQIRANKKELNMARNIQKGLIPAGLPDWEGMQFWVHYSPLHEVSGDFYDILPLPDNKISLLVCDVSGHGVPAALISAIAKLSFNNHKNHLPSDVFSNVNLDLLSFVKREGYLTAFYMTVDQSYNIVYSIAAVPSPYLYRAKTGEVEKLKGSGTLMGMFPDANELFMNQQMKMEPGDKLFIFTDGLTESVNVRDEPFGEERIVKAILESKDQDVKESIERIISRYREFSLGTDQHDDVTIVGVMISKQKKDFDDLLMHARKLYRRKRLDEACAKMQEAIALFPRQPDALYLLGKYRAMNGKYEEALESLNRYMELKPYDPNGYIILAYCLYRKGHFERAEQELKRSLSLKSENPSALYQLVKVQKKLGKTQDAATSLSALEYLKPYDVRVRNLK